MPNWCNNTIELSGPKDKIKAIFDKAKADDRLLNQLYPMPEALRETTSPTPQEGQAGYKGPQPVVDGYDNWYDWAVNNWKTKWDVDLEGLEYREEGDTGIIQGWFDSAWSPPTGAYDHFLSENDDCYIKS
tara:strand:- start:46 stop:435 length:390 start_codon:yes stop_codon:yes gene_type:complete